MKRITKKVFDDSEPSSDNLINDEYSDSCVLNQLRLYENYHEDLLIEYQQIRDKLDQLRQNNQSKTVTFKQLLSVKLQIEWTLLRIEKYLKK